MSGLWSRTLVYLGLREEDDELYYDYDVPHEDEAPLRRGDERRGTLVEDLDAPGPADRSRGRVRREDAGLEDPRIPDRGRGSGRDLERGSGRDLERDLERGRDRRRDRDDEDRGRSERRGREWRRGVPEREPEPMTDSGRIARIGDGDVRQIRPEERPRASMGSVVRVVQVTTFEDSEVIGSRFRGGQPVLFDLSNVEPSLARRVLDFVSGMTYVLHGTLRKVAKRAFLLVPDAVMLAPDERRRLSELGYDLSSLPTH